MRRISGMIVLLICFGCSSLKPVKAPPEQLHERISAGEIVRPGDDVRIITTDGKYHEFHVTAVTADTISGKKTWGKKTAVQIADVVTVEVRGFSGGKTTLLAGGTVLFVMLIIAAGTAALMGGMQ